MATAPCHQPVLRDAVVLALAMRPSGVYLDATFGRGGHALALLDRLDATGRLVVLDRDPEAITVAEARLGSDTRVRIVREDFTMLATVARELGPPSGFDGVLLDLGVSSPQLDDPARGFSFRHDGPLDMRMDPEQGESAAAWLARVGERELADVLYHLGDERYSRRIARVVIAERAHAPITTTARLAEIVSAAIPRRESDQHPATRTFQAIRIHVNQELEALDHALAALPDVLAPGGRAAVISFHSLEDRRVKRFIRAAEGRQPAVTRDHRGRSLPVAAAPARMRAVGPVREADAAEVEANPRARSARLRVMERLP